jgi:hypothetical protein
MMGAFKPIYVEWWMWPVVFGMGVVVGYALCWAFF